MNGLGSSVSGRPPTGGGGTGGGNMSRRVALAASVLTSLYIFVTLLSYASLSTSDDGGDGASSAAGGTGAAGRQLPFFENFKTGKSLGGAGVGSSNVNGVGGGRSVPERAGDAVAERHHGIGPMAGIGGGGTDHSVAATTSKDPHLSDEWHRFPMSVRTSESDPDYDPDQFEYIPHPGEVAAMALKRGVLGGNNNLRVAGAEDEAGITKMRVPKFWTPPPYFGGQKYLGRPDGGSTVMSREEALSIGSRIPPPPNSNADPSLLDPDGLIPTIYVAIASYRDAQCPHTLDSIYRRARFPTRVRVAVVDQTDVDAGDVPCGEPFDRTCDQDPDQPLCKYSHLIDVYTMEAKLGVGPVFARHVGHRLYRGEYYAVQVDAHVSFVNDWDVSIIQQWSRAGNEMAVLSTYLSDVSAYDERTGTSLVKTRPIMCNTDFEGSGQRQYLRNEQQPEGLPSVQGTPQIQPYWAAGFSFSRGHFIVNVPYDQYLPMIFQGEEINIGLRAFTYGYDIYAPESSVCFHMYAVGKNKSKRKRVKLFWEHSGLYAGVGQSSLDRLLGVIKMNPGVDPRSWDHAEEDRYGLGARRDVHKFYDLYGIDVVKKTTEGHLCRFVDTREAHAMFVRNLRSDGMGIDYDRIRYRHVDGAGAGAAVK